MYPKLFSSDYYYGQDHYGEIDVIHRSGKNAVERNEKFYLYLLQQESYYFFNDNGSILKISLTTY